MLRYKLQAVAIKVVRGTISDTTDDVVRCAAALATLNALNCVGTFDAKLCKDRSWRILDQEKDIYVV